MTLRPTFSAPAYGKSALSSRRFRRPSIWLSQPASWFQLANQQATNRTVCSTFLLLGGDKTGHDRWYEVHVPVADTLYDEHLATLKQEGLL
jgi:hypothetical protein